MTWRSQVRKTRVCPLIGRIRLFQACRMRFALRYGLRAGTEYAAPHECASRGSPLVKRAGVDALRALKASNPDLMGLAAKMAKKNSVTNLAQLDSGAPDSEA